MYVFMKFAARFVLKIGVKTQKKHFENQKFQHLFRYVFRQLEAHKKNTWVSIYSPFHISSKNLESNTAYLGGQIAFWKSYVNAILDFLAKKHYLFLM